MAFLSKQKPQNNFQLALLHTRLVESAKTLESLERASQLHEPELIYVKRELAFDGLDGSPRFRALTDAMKLPYRGAASSRHAPKRENFRCSTGRMF